MLAHYKGFLVKYHFYFMSNLIGVQLQLSNFNSLDDGIGFFFSVKLIKKPWHFFRDVPSKWQDEARASSGS